MDQMGGDKFGFHFLVGSVKMFLFVSQCQHQSEICSVPHGIGNKVLY